MKLALVLYAATLLARRPQQVHDLRELANPLLFVVAGACLLVVTQPDLGTAMVIAFTVVALLVAAGIPMRQARDARPPARSALCSSMRSSSPTRARG